MGQMNRSRFISTSAILISVLAMALIAGITFSTYNSDRNIDRDSDPLTLALPLSRIDRAMINFDHAAHGYLEMPDAHLIDQMVENIDVIGINLADLEANPALVDEAVVAEFTKALRDFEGAALSDLAAGGAAQRSQILMLSEMSHQILLDYPMLIDDQIRKYVTERDALLEDAEKATIRAMLASFLTMVLALFGMAYYMQLSSANEELAARNELLARRAGALNDAKSRLLTMLSHEMRTPLNGIVGLSNILKTSDMTAADLSMIDQIHSASLELTEVVGEMLAFADFTSISSEEVRNYIISQFFFDELNDELKTAAKTAGKSILFEIDPDFPKMFVGDYRRIYRGIYYLLCNILHNMPESRLKIAFREHNQQLVFKIDLHYQYEFDSDWQVENVMTRLEEESDRIVSEGIESTMARGLLQSLGAQMRVLHSEENESFHRLLVDIPIALQVPVPFCVAKAREDMVLPAPLDRYIDQWDACQVDDPKQALMIFANFASHERKNVQELRIKAPEATIIGVGAIMDPEVYDYTLFFHHRAGQIEQTMVF